MLRCRDGLRYHSGCSNIAPDQPQLVKAEELGLGAIKYAPTDQKRRHGDNNGR